MKKKKNDQIIYLGDLHFRIVTLAGPDDVITSVADFEKA